jgi:hypothetical protein
MALVTAESKTLEDDALIDAIAPRGFLFLSEP